MCYLTNGSVDYTNVEIANIDVDIVSVKKRNCRKKTLGITFLI